jgi:hypothetical protein
METIFDSLGIILYNANGHKGYTVQWKLIAPFCKKWSRNRDADQNRVKEMLQHFDLGGYVPKMIHLAELDDEGMVCYDGNHRKEVFNSSKDSELTCIVDVMFKASQSDVYTAFNNINKSVQLPAIYIEESSKIADVKVAIISLVKSYEYRFKALLSSSARCHAPHFNRDRFTDNVYDIYKALGCSYSIREIELLLERLNLEYSYGRICRPHSLYKPSLVEKCKKHNMWLFLEGTIPVEHVEYLLKNR